MGRSGHWGIGVYNARRHDVPAAVDVVRVRNLLVDSAGGNVVGLVADIIVRLQRVQALHIRALGALFTGLVETPLRAGLVQPCALGVLGVLNDLDHSLVRHGHA